MTAPVAALLPDGHRLHLQHGPIDLIVEAVAPDRGPGSTAGVMPRSGRSPRLDARSSDPARASRRAVGAPRHDAGGGPVGIAYEAAAARFATILHELCEELPLLRQPARPEGGALRGAVARRMWASVAPLSRDGFITPMAAVAGAVAEEVLAAMVAAAPLARASVNNGGDIALHLGEGGRVRIGLVDRPDRPGLFGATTLTRADPVRGVATSGWRGRSFSLGIADAVTILARTASEADAAATVVANSVDLPGHPAVTRVAAREIQCDSDLGDRLVTRAVAPLSPAEIGEALARGRAVADGLIRRGLIVGAALHLQGETATVGIQDMPQQPRHAEEAGADGRLEARATADACLETRRFASLLNMTPEWESRASWMDIAA